jgi:hypothetical protein
MSQAMLQGPIPGQSLTDEPGNYPWEKPPKTAKPEEALMMHIEKMSNPDFMEGSSILMEIGVPVEVITNTAVTGAVSAGIHSIDVGIIIAPAIHKEIVSIAKMTGVNYKEFFSDDAEVEAKQKMHVKALVDAKLRKRGSKLDKEEVSETMQAMTSPEVEQLEDMRDEQEGAGEAPAAVDAGMDMPPPTEEEGQQMPQEGQPPQETPQAAPQEGGTGLMSRGA